MTAAELKELRDFEIHLHKTSCIYTVSNGAIKTPKSVLFPLLMKSLCNNTEILRLINKYGHGIGYNLIEEIETEYALQVISKQKENSNYSKRDRAKRT